MARAGKYGFIAPGAIIGDFATEEPVFILRAQDVLSVFALTRYIRMARQAGCDEMFVNSLVETRREFIAWQADHVVKFPD